jgi:hypothetical protein
MTQTQRLLQFLQDYKPHNSAKMLLEVQGSGVQIFSGRRFHFPEVGRRAIGRDSGTSPDVHPCLVEDDGAGSKATDRSVRPTAQGVCGKCCQWPRRT